MGFPKEMKDKIISSLNIPKKQINEKNSSWWKYYSHITPYNVFKNKKLFGEYMTKPPAKSGKIVTLGII